METAAINIAIYDGTRQLLPATTNVLLTITDGNKQVVFRDYVKPPDFPKRVPFYDNLRDQYTVVATADGFQTAGFFPVWVSPKIVRTVFLMLLPIKTRFNFREAMWDRLRVHAPRLIDILRYGADDAAAQERYEDLIERQGPSLACLLNIVTAMRDLHLSQGTVVDYLRGLVWNNQDYPMLEDRFYAYAESALLEQVRVSAMQGAFVEEPNPGLLHKGATCSYKQIQFGEANLQLTFHEKAPTPVPNLVLVEPDIDYFKDMAAHALLEVLPGFFGRTDPETVYVLRWIAGHQANTPEFNPPYTIQAGV